MQSPTSCQLHLTCQSISVTNQPSAVLTSQLKAERNSPYYRWRRCFWQSFSSQCPPHRHLLKINTRREDEVGSRPRLEARLQPPRSAEQPGQRCADGPACFRLDAASLSETCLTARRWKPTENRGKQTHKVPDGGLLAATRKQTWWVKVPPSRVKPTLIGQQMGLVDWQEETATHRDGTLGSP